MAVTHPSTTRSLIADTVTGEMDGGSTFARMLLMTSGSTTLVTLQMGSSAFGAAAAGVCTGSTITDAIVLVAGTATLGLIQSSTQALTAVSFSVTSTGGGGDLELSSNVLSTGQTVSITALTYTAPT